VRFALTIISVCGDWHCYNTDAVIDLTTDGDGGDGSSQTSLKEIKKLVSFDVIYLLRTSSSVKFIASDCEVYNGSKLPRQSRQHSLHPSASDNTPTSPEEMMGILKWETCSKVCVGVLVLLLKPLQPQINFEKKK